MRKLQPTRRIDTHVKEFTEIVEILKKIRTFEPKNLYELKVQFRINERSETVILEKSVKKIDRKWAEKLV